MRFEPRPWNPPPAPPLEGPYEPNDRLAAAELVPTPGNGPEDPAVDDAGVVYTGLVDGTILAVSPTGNPEALANTRGRPLGIEVHPEGWLVVCDADRGLLRVTRDGDVETLVDAFEGRRLLFTNNATLGPDGTIYFTDSSQRYTIHDYVDDLLEHSGTGRLFALHPDGELEVLVDGLQFANGVALSDDATTLWVVETGRYLVGRYHLAGPRAGTYEPFLENLPGFPDNLSFGGGILWVPLASPRQPLVDKMMPRPWLRRLAHRLPASLKPKPVRHGIVLGFRPDGTLAHNLQDTTGTVAVTTGARYHDGRLVVGSLVDPHLAVVTLD
ncbi:MAG TPA: SMP-30/gluconolactonase/LRE family protein [Actinobacteria bacterium]|nr:SMP-30/gluconolactonase/LRE family protein [Actinomycetota bacterium]